MLKVIVDIKLRFYLFFISLEEKGRGKKLSPSKQESDNAAAAAGIWIVSETIA